MKRTNSKEILLKLQNAIDELSKNEMKAKEQKSKKKDKK